MSSTVVDVDHCHTCGAPYLPCGTPWPPSLHDVVPVRCALPRGHRSAEHWHAALWANTESIVWIDESADEPKNAGTNAAR